MPHSMDSRKRREILAECLIVVTAVTITAIVARPYAGSWNDGSRLATVESLVDRHTWIIDDSIFVRVPRPEASSTPLPYHPSDRALLEHGTQDKLFIDGHYYSDKSPVPAVVMAACYRLWHWTTGMTARMNPDRFCRAMTLASSGMAFVVAVWCMYRLGRHLHLPLPSRLLLTASFAFATVALPYARQVNNHILLLAVASLLTLRVASIRQTMPKERTEWRRYTEAGFLAGLGYTIDLGVGPVILICTFFLILSVLFGREPEASLNSRARFRLAAKRAILFALAALPWVVLHHGLNYAIGGSLKPANANPDFFRWPGSPFAAANLTGSCIHPNVGSFVLYSASMLVGKRGFLGHNLPLFLTIPALFVMWRRHREMTREVGWAVGFCVGTWLLYAATSNNSSGQCCTIRWFVPLLAPAYFVVALLVQRSPRYRLDLLVLSCWGTLLVVLMRDGPWMGGMVRFFWPIQAAALGSWALSHYLRRPGLELVTQHPYTNSCGNSMPSGKAASWLWITALSSSGARANTISATSTSTCPETSSSSSPA